jgi:hypothetical protein
MINAKLSKSVTSRGILDRGLMKHLRVVTLLFAIMGVFIPLLNAFNEKPVAHKEPQAKVVQMSIKPVIDEDRRLKFFMLYTLSVYAKENTVKDNIVIVDSILSESKRYNRDPLKMFAIMISETGGKTKAKHSLKHVVGVCGINVKVWAKPLMDVKVIASKKELYTIKGNIKAMAYIYDCKMDECKDKYASALHAYKGKVKETLYQVHITMNIYNSLKKQYNTYKV